jgi:hypothetical protein
MELKGRCADRVTHARLTEKIIFCTGLKLNTDYINAGKLISSCMAMHDLFETDVMRDSDFFQEEKNRFLLVFFT